MRLGLEVGEEVEVGDMGWWRWVKRWRFVGLGLEVGEEIEVGVGVRG